MNNRAESHLTGHMETELGRVGNGGWVNQGYSSSPPPLPQHVGTIYNPKTHFQGSMDNPYKRDTPVPLPEDPPSMKKKKRRGCCSFIRALWGTTLTEETSTNKELYIRTTMRELLVYIFFLVDLCLLTYGMTSSSAYYYSTAMTNLFVNTAGAGVAFQSIGCMNDFWAFAQGPLLDGLYWTQWYNGAPLGNKSFIYYENMLLGVPRIRQVRVKNNSCTISSDFRNEIEGCFDVYSVGKEDDQSFGLVNGTAWTHHTEKELKGSSYWGLLTTYSGAGYYQDLSLSRSDSTDMLTELYDNQWLDRGTRAVFIDFSTYNANINLFSVITLVVEFPAVGGAVTSYQVRTVKLIRYVGTWDYFILGCECLFCVFILYYIVEEILELSIHKFSYFFSIWNILDIVVILLAIVSIIFNVFRTVKVGNLLGKLLQDPDIYADFGFLAFWQTQYNNMNAVNLFFAWIKIFKYISFSKTMNQLSSTLGRCAKDIFGFAIMFFIVFFAFAQLGYLLFGTQVQSFSTFVTCIFTQFRIILGDFNFDAINSANRVLGPIYFVTYVFFVFFVLLNMFLAIINDTYTEVKGELSSQKDDLHFTDLIKQSYLKTFMKLKLKKEKISDVQKALQSGSGEIEFEKFREALKDMGHSDSEISAAFSKFDRDGNKVLDEDEQRKMKTELEEKKASLSAEITNLGKNYQKELHEKPLVTSSEHKSQSAEPSVDRHRYASLSEKVQHLERTVADISFRIELIMTKMGLQEKAKDAGKAGKQCERTVSMTGVSGDRAAEAEMSPGSPAVHNSTNDCCI